MTLCVFVCVFHRDGGLKRAKVKDSLKEQQQKKYSHMVVGDDSSDWTLMTEELDILIHQSLEICQLVDKRTGGIIYTTAAIIQFKDVYKWG